MNSSPGNNWETSDANTRPLFVFLAALTLLVIASFFVTSWVLKGLEEGRAVDIETHPMEGFQTAPHGPLLQSTVTGELEEHRQYEEGLLSSFAWVDPHDGIIRVPIEHAMDLLLERGLPVREEEHER